MAPGLLVTERFTVTPGHTGFGVAEIPTGAVGAFGSVKTTGPAACQKGGNIYTSRYRIFIVLNSIKSTV